MNEAAAEKAEILRLLAEGAFPRAVAERLGLPVSRVQQIWAEARAEAKRRKRTEDAQSQIRAANDLDWLWPVETVLAALDLNTRAYNSLERYLRKDGLTEANLRTVMDRLLPAVDVTPAGYRLRTMLEVLYSSGIRIAELLGLNLGDVDFANATAKVLGKGRKERMVPVGKTALQYLQSYMRAIRAAVVENGEQQALFVDSAGNRFPYHTFRRLVKVWAGKAGLSLDVTPHTFRRYAERRIMPSRLRQAARMGLSLRSALGIIRGSSRRPLARHPRGSVWLCPPA
jgi:integrase